MHAIVYQHYGTPDVMEFNDIAIPKPGPGEVLVRVHAASVNPYDWHFLRGTPGFIRLFTGLGKPKSPRLGADLAGVVEAVGPQVQRIKPGDAVFGVGKGAFAEYACAKESQLALKPGQASFEQAAAIPIAGITALQGLRDAARLQARQTVLINGAAGGVGTFAVQIARHLGAQVTAVCSARNLEMVRSLGAERAIDYAREDFTQTGEQYDILFDLVGTRSLGDMRRALKPGGTFVGCGGGGPDRGSLELLGVLFAPMLASPFVSQRLTGIHARINPSDLAVLAGLVDSGKLTSVLDRNYPLAQTADAVRYVEQGHARGKVTITVAQD